MSASRGVCSQLQTCVQGPSSFQVGLQITSLSVNMGVCCFCEADAEMQTSQAVHLHVLQSAKSQYLCYLLQAALYPRLQCCTRDFSAVVLGWPDIANS